MIRTVGNSSASSTRRNQNSGSSQAPATVFALDSLSLSASRRRRTDPPPVVDPNPPSGGDTPPVVDPNPPSGGDTPPVVDPNPPSGGDFPPVVDPNPPSGGDNPPVVDPNPPGGFDPPPPVVNPAPPPPRYYFPVPPVFLPQGDPRPLAQVPELQYPVPHHAPIVPPTDVLQLLDHFGMLHKKDHHSFLFFSWDSYSNIDEAGASAALSQGQSIWVDEGGKKVEVTSADQLQPMLKGLQNRYVTEQQQIEARQDQQARDAVDQRDIANRRAALPAFNNVYDTGRLELETELWTMNGNAVNRDIDTAVSFYQSDEVQNDLAVWWHQHPDATTARFNAYANSVLQQKFNDLAAMSGVYASEDPSLSFISGNPVPGLRYPDTQDDVNWNQDVITKVALNTPAFLDGSLYR